MNRNQMEMLSVKSAIERTVEGYVSAYTQSQGTEKEFFAAIERYVAALFVSGQIDNNYLVRSIRWGLEISFSTGGHYTRVSFILPDTLCWKVQPDPSKNQVPSAEDLDRIKSLHVTPSSRDILCEGSVRVGPSGQLEIYVNGKWVTAPSHMGIGSGTGTSDPTSDPATEVKEEEFDPVKAYERAKKAVGHL